MTRTTGKITTADIRDHIEKRKEAAGMAGQSCMILTARDVSQELALDRRYPMICNAMRQCMREGDEILFSTPSGYSSTLEIRYQLKR